MNQTIEQLKSEISDQYLKDFKDELGWMKSLALLPIEKKVKKILIGASQLPEKFDEVKEFGRWKDIINFVSPRVASQIFDFMKEKRLEIEKRKTEDELRKLRAEILGESIEGTFSVEEIAIPDPQIQNSSDIVQSPVSSETESEETGFSNVNPVAAGVATSVGGVAMTKILANDLNAKELSQMAENFDGEKAKKLLNDAVDALEKQKAATNSRLSEKQINTIDKHISKLKEGVESADDDVIKLLKEWQKLDTKLPKKLLVGCGLSASQLSKIDNLASQLVGKDSKAIKEVLEQNGLSKVSDDVISALSKAGTEAELKTMTKILKHGSKTNRFIQAFAGAMLIDVACLGLDVWMYLETQKEVDLIAKVNEVRAQNKRNQANTQLWIGVGSVAVEAAIIIAAMAGGTAVGGPFGTVVGLAVGGLATAASIGVDALYFDVQDFYKQNREDFLRQRYAQLNQAILQGIHNRKEGDKSLNEKLGSPEPAQKLESLRDACWSMLFLDELQNGEFASYAPFWSYIQSGEKKADFVDKLPFDQASEFGKKRDEIELKIAQRMEYVRQELDNPAIIQSLKAGGGMQGISKLFSNSRVYAAMKSQNKWDQNLDFEKNFAVYKSEFFAEFPKEKLEKIEKIRQEKPYLFQELMATTTLSSLLRDTEGLDSNYDQNVQLVIKYQEWLNLTLTNSERIGLEIPDSSKNMRFIESFLEADFDLDKVVFVGNSAEQVKDLVNLRQERRAVMEISDDPMQNVLYRLAKELYGYTGENEKVALMAFYDESLGNNHGIYFSDERKINEDWRKDFVLKTELPSNFPQSEINNKVDEFFKSEFGTRWVKQGVMFLGVGGLIWGLHSSSGVGPSIIDTPTEAIDDYLQQEFENQFRTILKQELLARTQENQQKVRNQISSFVQQQAKNGEYVELPYYLLLEARRAGFGDLQKQFYTRKNGQLEVVMLPSDLNNTDALDAKKNYLTKAREQFSAEEQVYIQRVEEAHQNLENLRNLGGTAFWGEGFEDDLDIPKEIEVLISDKYKKRNAFKSDVLLYSAESATSSDILMQYQEFAEYFENLYCGILMSLSDFKVSNDVDSFALYYSALGLGSQNLFNERGDLNSDLSPSVMKNEKIRAFYSEQLSKQSVDGKTLVALWTSEDPKEQVLAKRASEAILLVILEQNFLRKAEDGKITNIVIGGNWFDGDTNNFAKDKSKTEELIAQKLSQLQILPDLDRAKIVSLQTLQQEIKPLNQVDEKVVDQMSETQKQIEATMSEVVWQGKRGNLIYDPEKSTILSRNNEVEIEIKGDKLYLKGLDVALTPKELVWLANFRNWVKYKYTGEDVSFKRDVFNRSFSLRKTFVIDGIMLISRGDLEKHMSVCKDDAVMQEMTVWLNSALK